MKPLVIDCSQLCYNSFYTMNDLSYDEKLTGVTFGFLLQIFKLAKDFDTNQFVFCWDSSKSYREQTYPSYKISRKNKREELTDEEKDDLRQLHRQRNDLRMNIIPSLGFKNNLIKTGLEADDLIAWVVDKNHGVIVVSSDNDLWQLLDHCEMYNIKTKERLYDLDFEDKYGIKPIEWADVKELAGCDGDDVEGIQGVGYVKAIQYLKGELPKAIVYKRIKNEEKEIRERNRKLVRLPFEEDINNMGEIDFDEQFKLSDWLNVFNKYGFKYFLKKDFLTGLKQIFNLK